MTAADLPFKWFSPGGIEQLWGTGNTYVEVPQDLLPRIAGDPLDGSFRWLVRPAVGVDAMDEEDRDGDFDQRIEALVRAARSAKLEVPAPFIKFMTNSELRGRVPSCTACYFEVGTRLVLLPGRKGSHRLLRFMNDQQCCLLWYLLLEPGGTHRVACARPKWRHDNAENLDDAVEPRDVVVCASSFEEFIRRFWIENTLWYAVNKGAPPLEGELRAYLDAAARSRRS